MRFAILACVLCACAKDPLEPRAGGCAGAHRRADDTTLVGAIGGGVSVPYAVPALVQAFQRHLEAQIATECPQRVDRASF